MSQSKLYEYALIYHPKSKKNQESKPSELIGDVKRILAPNNEVAKMTAVRDIPEKYNDMLDRVDVVIRPF